MNHGGGESAGVAADLELRQRLDEASSHKTPTYLAIEGLSLVVDHATRWLDGIPAQTDPTEAMRTIRRVAADAWDRALAKRNEVRTEGSEWR